MSETGGPDPEPYPSETVGNQQAAERRNRLIIAGSAVAVVVIIVVSFFAVKASTGKKRPPAAATTASPAARPSASPAQAAALAALTSIPTSVTDAVGSGGSQVEGKPLAIPGQPLTANGKPEVFYAGAEFCPFCAAQRWSIILALSRFGTFSGVQPIRSAAADGAGNSESYPNTATWTFYGSSYTSSYLTFTPVETLTNIPDPSTGSYTKLQTPTKAQQALIGKWDASPYVPSGESGAIPFIDFGGKYIMAGAGYSPGLLASMSWSQIAAATANPATPIAKGAGGTANYITAALCKLTGNQPASACTGAVQALAGHI